MRTLTIVYHQGGGGHRNAAEALKGILTAQKDPWEVAFLDIQELLDRIDVVRRSTGLRIQDTYNLILRRGLTRFTPQLLKVLQTTIKVYHSAIVKLLREYWAEHPADLVLSVIPHFNRQLAESLKMKGKPKPPFVTLITDLADYPPHFWIERESEYLIVGTEHAKEQALAMGHTENHIFLASGMVLKPKFYGQATVDPAQERKKCGLKADILTGIVLFGGHGSRVMVDIVKNLDRAAANVQLILLCGHNQKLEAQLRAIKTRNPKLVLGFTTNVEHYMALSDFFIGKPGPGSISEALQFHLPVIVECNSRTLPQERYNATWVVEQGYGIVVRSFTKVASAVAELTESATFEKVRNAANGYTNHALTDVSSYLNTIFLRAISRATSS